MIDDDCHGIFPSKIDNYMCCSPENGIPHSIVNQNFPCEIYVKVAVVGLISWTIPNKYHRAYGILVIIPNGRFTALGCTTLHPCTGSLGSRWEWPI
jgi:hypothetical protein